MSKNRINSNSTILSLLFLGIILLAACQTTAEIIDPQAAEGLDLTEYEVKTLSGLEQIDDYPLYTMVYFGDYKQAVDLTTTNILHQGEWDWACSLFATFGDPANMLFGRNFDWDFSPGLLLFTDPQGGYKSVSMVDLYYLGFGDEMAFGIKNLPLEEKVRLLDAPYIPFDGMNEAGLVVGMAAVPDGGMDFDPEKETIDSLMAIRLIRDRAATIEEAVDIIKSYNIDMGSGPALHYLIAEESGRSVLVEFSGGEVVVFGNTETWQAATNFLMSEVGNDPQAQCWRYDVITNRLRDEGGRISAKQAIGLLAEVSQENTQLSVVYRATAKEIWIAMGRDYDQVFRFEFE